MPITYQERTFRFPIQMLNLSISPKTKVEERVFDLITNHFDQARLYYMKKAF